MWAPLFPPFSHPGVFWGPLEWPGVMGDFRVLNVDFRMGEMGSFCRNGGAEGEGGVGFRGSGFGVREEYAGG